MLLYWRSASFNFTSRFMLTQFIGPTLYTFTKRILNRNIYLLSPVIGISGTVMLINWNFIIGWRRHHVVPAAAAPLCKPLDMYYMHTSSDDDVKCFAWHASDGWSYADEIAVGRCEWVVTIGRRHSGKKQKQITFGIDERRSAGTAAVPGVTVPIVGSWLSIGRGQIERHVHDVRWWTQSNNENKTENGRHKRPSAQRIKINAELSSLSFRYSDENAKRLIFLGSSRCWREKERQRLSVWFCCCCFCQGLLT